MKYSLPYFIGLLIILSGCSRNELPERTQSQLLEKYKNASATVVNYGGPSSGPYREADGFAGNVDRAFKFSWKENDEVVSVEAPAAPGHHYQLSRFGTESGRYFWILLKVKSQKESSGG
jgi:hypothetical protein